MSKKCFVFTLIFVVLITIMAVSAGESEAKDPLGPRYTVITIYCENKDCQTDDMSDLRLKNKLNIIMQTTKRVQHIDVIPLLGHNQNYHSITSGYTIIVEFLEKVEYVH